jgi:hypothetical protein
MHLSLQRPPSRKEQRSKAGIGRMSRSWHKGWFLGRRNGTGKEGEPGEQGPGRAGVGGSLDP